jgi:hypothetical protein
MSALLSLARAVRPRAAVADSPQRTPAGPIAELLEGRSRLEAERDRLNVVAQGSIVAENLLNEIQGDEAALNTADAQRFAEWTKNPTGPSQKPDAILRAAKPCCSAGALRAGAKMHMHAGTALDQAARALERHRVAKASGERNAIAAVRCDLERAQGALLRVKAEAKALAEVAKAGTKPRRIGW